MRSPCTAILAIPKILISRTAATRHRPRPRVGRNEPMAIPPIACQSRHRPALRRQRSRRRYFFVSLSFISRAEITRMWLSLIMKATNSQRPASARQCHIVAQLVSFDKRYSGPALCLDQPAQPAGEGIAETHAHQSLQRAAGLAGCGASPPRTPRSVPPTARRTI